MLLGSFLCSWAVSLNTKRVVFSLTTWLMLLWGVCTDLGQSSQKTQSWSLCKLWFIAVWNNVRIGQPAQDRLWMLVCLKPLTYCKFRNVLILFINSECFICRQIYCCNILFVSDLSAAVILVSSFLFISVAKSHCWLLFCFGDLSMCHMFNNWKLKNLNLSTTILNRLNCAEGNMVHYDS